MSATRWFLKEKMESALTAAQDQAIRGNYGMAEFEKDAISFLCRVFQKCHTVVN